MAIKIAKKTTTVAAEQKPLSDFADRIDEVGSINSQIEKLRAAIAEKAKAEVAKLADLEKKQKKALADLVKDINAHLEDEDADAELVEQGNKFQAEAGKKINVRTVTDMAMVKELMDAQDPNLFMSVVKIDLKSVDDYLTPQERDAVITKSRGKREIKIVKRG